MRERPRAVPWAAGSKPVRWLAAHKIVGNDFGWRAAPAPKGWARDGPNKSPGAICANLERPAEEQVERLVPMIVEAAPQVDRPEEGIEPQEQARILVQVVEIGIAHVLPDVARLERHPEIHRHVEVSRPATPDLAIEQQPADTVVRPVERVLLQARQVEEPSERKVEPQVRHAVENAATRQRERERIAIAPGVRREQVESDLVGVGLPTHDVACSAPLQHCALTEMREVDVIQRVVAQPREVGARAEALKGGKQQFRIARIADGEARMPLLAINPAADLPPVAELLAEIDAVVERVHPILCALALSDEERQVARADRDVRHDEPA